VKGKSGLKLTQQLLECWRGRPDLPTLTVVGRFSWDEVKESVNAPNIVLYPQVGAVCRDSVCLGSWERVLVLALCGKGTTRVCAASLLNMGGGSSYQPLMLLGAHIEPRGGGCECIQHRV
jgi:hypothetical protein